MIRRIFALMIISILSVSAMAGQKAKRESPSIGQIRAVLDAQVEAWNRRDLEGFMKGYWNSPDLSFYSNATKTAGWKSTIDRYRLRYQSEGREMGTLTFSELQIEMLGPAAAFVRGHWNLKMNAGEAGGLFTLIFRKFPEGWKIIHDHTGASS
jgi:beta-aspartyl-peptidase (threonine type)